MTVASQAIARHANGLFDYDWYRFTAGASGTLTVNLNISQMLSGSDLHVRVYTLVNGALVELGSSRRTGGVSSQSVSVSVAAGQQLFVSVYGFNFAQGAYDLELNL